MQTIAEVQSACDRLAVMMAEKGLQSPEVEFLIVSQATPRVWIKHTAVDGSTFRDRHYHSFRTFDEAETYILALPSPDEHHRAEFLTLAGKAADYAAEHLQADPIAAEVRASIVAGMKRLSENALTAA